MNSNQNFTFIDLFAGIGGFHHALSSIGGRCVMTCEFDPECQKVYKNTFMCNGANFKFVSNIREITRDNIDDETTARSAEQIAQIVPDHDVLCGGFPCQPFSKSGEQKGVRDRTRGTLFFDIMQILEAKRPKFVFLENVRNIAGPRHQETWATVIESIRAYGYHVSRHPMIFSPHLLPPELGGAPQVRERVFILGVRNDVESNNIVNVALFNALLQKKNFWNPDDWSIEAILDDDAQISNLNSYCVSEDEETYLSAWNYFVENFPGDKLPGFPIWAFAFQNVPEITLGMPGWKVNFLTKNSEFYNDNKEFIDNFLKMRWGAQKLSVLEFPYSRQILEWQARKKHPSRTGRTLRDLVIQFRPSGIRVKPPTYLPALVAITQTSVVGPLLRDNAQKFRKLTPIEAGRLQGIPDSVYKSGVVSDKAAYKQLGNAVNVGIVRATAEVFMGLKFYDSMKFLDQSSLHFSESPTEFGEEEDQIID